MASEVAEDTALVALPDSAELPGSAELPCADEPPGASELAGTEVPDETPAVPEDPPDDEVDPPLPLEHAEIASNSATPHDARIHHLPQGTPLGTARHRHAWR